MPLNHGKNQIMIISKERLIKEQKTTGYRQEMIEKVVWLIEILNAIAQDSFLKDRLVLKGGTALNLFHFDLPRLSVDADLNYIGSVDRTVMEIERPQIKERIQQLFQRMGLSLSRNAEAHAGGKMTWRYPSALGNQGNVEVDLNFMYRIPLLPIEQRGSIQLAGQQVNNLSLLDLHELAAGKLVALIDRGAGRDFFDAYQLFKHPALNLEKLRLCFVIYAAMSTVNFLNIQVDQVNVDQKDLQNKLIPVLNHNFSKGFSSSAAWIDHLAENVKLGLKQLLPFSEHERSFFSGFSESYEIKAELLTEDNELIKKIKSHPALLWACKRMNKKS